MTLDNFRTIELIWDRVNKSIIKTIKAASSDTTGRYLSVKILDGGQEVTLNDAKLQLYWEHPNFNTSGMDDFDTVNNGGLFKLTFSDEMLTNVGKLNAHLVLKLSNGKITSDGFTIEVIKGADNGVVVPSDSYGLIKQIEGKIDKGNVKLNDLTQEVKEAMTGGSVAVVGVDAVGTENVKNGAISPTKTDFIKKSSNLLDPANVEHGKRYTTDNVKENNSAWNLIKLDVKPNETFTVRNAVRATIFDDSGNYYVTRSRLSTETDKFTFTTGLSGHVAYITTSAYNFDTEQINKGEDLLPYEDYYQHLDNEIGFENGAVRRYDIANKSLTEDETTFLIKSEKAFVNLYDKSYLGVQDTYVRFLDGTIATISGRTATDFIPFPENTGYIKKTSQIVQPVVFYDKNFNFIKSDNISVDGTVDNITGYVGTSPEGTAYIRLTIFDANKDSDFIYLSEKSQLYKAPTLVGNDGNLAGKNGVAFGDSITMGATYTNDFPNYVNVGFSGTRLMDIGTDTPHPQLSMVYLVDAIVSGDWTALELAATSVSTEFEETLNRLKAIDFNNVDFITIFYGANDSGTVEVLANRMGAVDSESRRTWNGAINYVVETMLTNYPHIQIYLLTPMYRTTENYITEPLADAMVVQGNRWKLPVLDLHREMGLNHLTVGTLTRDGTHPNDLGNKRLTEKIIGFLKTN